MFLTASLVFVAAWFVLGLVVAMRMTWVYESEHFDYMPYDKFVKAFLLLGLKLLLSPLLLVTAILAWLLRLSPAVRAWEKRQVEAWAARKAARSAKKTAAPVKQHKPSAVWKMFDAATGISTVLR